MSSCYHFPNLSSLLFTAFLSIITFSPVAISTDPLYTRCSYKANYTSNSAFETNLNLLLSSLSSSTATTGFFNDTKGDIPNQVYGLALCRGDGYGSSDPCQACLSTSVQRIVEACPRQKTAIIWFNDCLLRYSDRNFFSVADTTFRFFMWNPNNVSERTKFSQFSGQLMNDLIVKAAYNSNRMFAIGALDFTSFAKLFGLAQCTRDLSPRDCYGCLYAFTQSIPDYCNGKQGCRIYGSSCLLRFELYPFYNLTADTAAPTPPPPTATIVTAPTPPEVSSPPDTTTTTTSSAHGKSESTATVVVVVVPVVAVLVLLSATYLYMRRWRKASRLTVRPMKNGGDQPELRCAESLLFDLAVLRDATNDFSQENKLGEGGFGPVYRGVLSDGREIAVKRLSTTSGQGLVELRNEVILTANLEHRNLVRLLGCCLDEQEKLLVYEYLPNKSLDKILSDPERRARLDWEKRYKIIEGIGRGLLYLHEDSRLRIIHRDLKASNILLDEDMNPKISDFGIAKLFSLDETQGNTTRIAGTYGYMAPEYALHGLFSIKSDVFSYGVLVLEIVTGRLNSSFPASGNSSNLLSHVWKHWEAGMALRLRDQILGDRITPGEVLRCIQIGLLCVQEDAADRPSMASVALMLSGRSISLEAPSPPAFLFSTNTSTHSTLHGRNVGPALERINERATLSRIVSLNDVSVSDLDPR